VNVWLVTWFAVSIIVGGALIAIAVGLVRRLLALGRTLQRFQDEVVAPPLKARGRLARSPATMLNIGPLELVLILLIALVVVGPRKLPDLGRTIGNGLREFRKAQDEVRKSLQLEDLQDVRREISEAQRGVRQALRFDEPPAASSGNGATTPPPAPSSTEPGAPPLGDEPPNPGTGTGTDGA
jgi:sec-independent protein translocase protein TatA